VNLASFAELAVRLVNSAVCDAEADPLRTCEAFRELVADRPNLAAGVTRDDLDLLRLLRSDLAEIFTLASRGAEADAVARLNALLTVHPVHPVLARHGSERWHVHLEESGSVADRYAAAAVVSLAVLVSQLSAERFGICAIASCDRVFIDGSSNRSRRYCTGHSPTRGNVASISRQRRDAPPETAGSAESAAS
jgi:putative stress-induced transcription regulator/CGNR zinc finger protein